MNRHSGETSKLGHHFKDKSYSNIKVIGNFDKSSSILRRPQKYDERYFTLLSKFKKSFEISY